MLYKGRQWSNHFNFKSRSLSEIFWRFKTTGIFKNVKMFWLYGQAKVAIQFTHTVHQLSSFSWIVKYVLCGQVWILFVLLTAMATKCFLFLLLYLFKGGWNKTICMWYNILCIFYLLCFTVLLWCIFAYLRRIFDVLLVFFISIFVDDVCEKFGHPF